MGNRKKKTPIIINNIKIIDTAYKGKAITKHEGKVIFVEGGVPGDICDIQVFKKKKKILASTNKKNSYLFRNKN